MGRAARNLSNLKNRQPLQALYTDANSGLGQLYTDIIKQELNVKDVQFLTDMSQFTAYTFKPQLKLLGKVPIEPAYAEFADQGEFDKVSNPYLDGAWEALYELERERQKKESGETAEA